MKNAGLVGYYNNDYTKIPNKLLTTILFFEYN